jgi:hypothetical protein
MTSTRSRLLTGRALSALATLFLLLDGVMKVARAQVSLEAMAQLGYPVASVPLIGALLLAGVILYVVPTTSVMGALWLTAYLGGAVATHVRVGHPWLSHALFPVYVAAFAWAGLLLRRPALWALLRPGAGRDSKP